MSPYKTTQQLETELLIELLKDFGGYAEYVTSIVLIEPLNRYEMHVIKTVNNGIEICRQMNNPAVAIMASTFGTRQNQIQLGTNGGKQ